MNCDHRLSILCTGSSGLVASAFKQLVQSSGYQFQGLDLSGEEQAVNILNKDDLHAAVSAFKADNIETQPVLYHFAAITLTGTNLTQEQIDLSWKLNVDGTQNVLDLCRELSIPMVHISTDFVFSGAHKETPYMSNDHIQPDDTIYAQTKAKAEDLVMAVKDDQHVTIIRLAFPYGNMGHPKPCLLKKMLSWMDNQPEVTLYVDQHICPTPVDYIAKACLKTAEILTENKIPSGTILHTVGQPTTPYEFGTLIKQIFDKKAVLKPGSIEGKGAKILVLDTTESEQILGIKTPKHEVELKRLKILSK